MLYQLRNGKVINIPTRVWLLLSDEELKDLEGMNVGDYPTSPFYGSEIKKTSRKKPKDPYDTDGLDFFPDSEEVDHNNNFDINDIPDEEVEFDI